MGCKQQVANAISFLEEQRAPHKLTYSGYHIILYDESGNHVYNYYPSSGGLYKQKGTRKGPWDSILPATTVRALRAFSNYEQNNFAATQRRKYA